MRINQNAVEISGTPAQVWGNVLIPTNGNMRLKIAGDVLQSTHKTWLEKRESWTRIQNIDSVEIMEAPIYPLLAIGSFLSFLGLRGLFDVNIFLLFLLFLGISLILFAILKKRRYLAVMSHRNTIAVFMNKPPEVYQQFAMNLMLISRQLNAPVNSQSQNRQSHTQAA